MQNILSSSPVQTFTVLGISDETIKPKLLIPPPPAVEEIGLLKRTFLDIIYNYYILFFIY